MHPHVPVFIIGCGDIGSRLADLCMAQDLAVTALARTPQRAELLGQRGITACPGNLDLAPPTLHLPATIETLVYLAPPPPVGAVDPRITHCLAALPTPPSRIVYISTSGVYGDAGGRWIDEDHPAAPITERALRRWNAECQLQDYAVKHGCGLVILRVPGIYGKGRLPEARIREGLPVVLPEEAPWSNRIHADDLAQACLKASLGSVQHGIFNVSDGHPSTMTDYFWQVADHLKLPRPSAIPLDQARQILSPAMMSFHEESKRLRNDRLRAILGVDLLYPSLAEGLRAC